MFLKKFKKKNTNRYNYKIVYFNFYPSKNNNLSKYLPNIIKKRQTNIKYISKKKTQKYNINSLNFFNIFILSGFFFNFKKLYYTGFFIDYYGFMFLDILRNNFCIGDFFFFNFYLLKKIKGFKFFLLSLNFFDKVYKVKYAKFFFSILPGTYSLILKKYIFNKFSKLYLSSNKFYYIDYLSTCILGIVSNIFFKKYKYSNVKNKLILKGKLIKVRGCAKNPVDHHNGGNTRGKKKFLNFWGKIAKSSK